MEYIVQRRALGSQVWTDYHDRPVTLDVAKMAQDNLRGTFARSFEFRLAARRISDPWEVVGDSGELADELSQDDAELVDFADLIVRMAIGLAYEGIGPDPDKETDGAVIDAAVCLVRDHYDDHELWEAGLLAVHDSPEDCARCRAHSLASPLPVFPRTI